MFLKLGINRIFIGDDSSFPFLSWGGILFSFKFKARGGGGGGSSGGQQEATSDGTNTPRGARQQHVKVTNARLSSMIERVAGFIIRTDTHTHTIILSFPISDSLKVIIIIRRRMKLTGQFRRDSISKVPQRPNATPWSLSRKQTGTIT
jgi:hypothetical protein